MNRRRLKVKDYIFLRLEEFLQQAGEELKKGDLRQVGEKYWGAATQVVKALAEKKGYRHDDHARLFSIVDRISSETKKEGYKKVGIYTKDKFLESSLLKGLKIDLKEIF